MVQKKLQRLKILGAGYSLLLRERVLESILQDALAGRPGYVCVSNVHTTMTGFFDPIYQQALNESSYTVPDGVPIVWAMNALGASDFFGGESQDRVRGPSMMKTLCDIGRAHGLKHYLYGASEKTLALLQAHLHATYPGIQIVGAESPPFRPLSEQEMIDAADRINKSGAQIVWIGLGAPKQERWCFEQRHRVKPVMMAIGAAFDLLPGIVPEAPPLMQKFALEWLYRLWREPRRLWKRYIFNNPAFIVLITAQILANRLFRKSYLCESKPCE